MDRSPRAIWFDRVRRWRASGLTARAFASSIGVNANTLAWWAWRLGAEATETPLARVAGDDSRPIAALPFVEVVGVPAASTCDDRFEIALAGGCTVRVPPRFDDAALRRLLAVVEGR